MPDIFDELKAGMDQPREPSPLTGVLAPELIEATDPETLALMARGLLRAVSGVHHEDVLLGGISDDIKKLVQGPPQPGEPKEVTELRDKVLAGSAVVDRFVRIADNVRQNPVAAKVGALRDAVQLNSYTPGLRRANRAPQRKPTQGTPSHTEARKERANPEHRRRIFEQLTTSGEALINFSGTMVLCQIDKTKAVLLDIQGDEDPRTRLLDSRDREASVWASNLTLLQPDASVVQKWEKAILEENSQAVETGRLFPERVKIVNNEGGIWLYSPSENWGAYKNTTGRGVLVDTIDKLNPPVSREVKSPIYYQLAVWDEVQGNYMFFPTAHASAHYHGTAPLLNTDANLTDWLKTVYGTLPACFYVVDEGEEGANETALYAYSSNTDVMVGEEEILSADVLDDIGMRRSSFSLSLLGFSSNIDAYQATAGDEEEVGAALGSGSTTSSFARQAVVPLTDGADLAFISGAPSFSAIKSFHRRGQYSSDHAGMVLVAGITNLHTSDPNSPSAGEYSSLDNTKIFALRNPVVLGVTQPSFQPNAAYRRLAEERDRTAFVDDLSSRVSKLLGPAIKAAVQEIVDSDKDK